MEAQLETVEFAGSRAMDVSLRAQVRGAYVVVVDSSVCGRGLCRRVCYLSLLRGPRGRQGDSGDETNDSGSGEVLR